MWLTPLLLVAVLLLFACAHWALRGKFPKDEAALVDAIDRLLPQTQCAQCGYPGCRPYAAAIAGGEARNLCPPGGAEAYHAIVQLMGEDHAKPPPAQASPAVAVIDESQCIGCALCLPPCPVDAIVGAANKMHTVIEAQCTGCELCIPACPVDCISLQPLHFTPTSRGPASRMPSQPARACINCGLCNPVCPVDLPAQELLHALQQQNLAGAAAQGLVECIECGLCDRACPSNIAMASLFASGKQQSLAEQAASRQRLQYKARFEAHTTRQAQQQAAAADKRAQRLRRAAKWS